MACTDQACDRHWLEGLRPWKQQMRALSNASEAQRPKDKPFRTPRARSGKDSPQGQRPEPKRQTKLRVDTQHEWQKRTKVRAPWGNAKPEVPRTKVQSEMQRTKAHLQFERAKLE
jgi:hypothetical protein